MNLSLLFCFPDFRGKGGYPSLPPGGRPSSTVLYPGPPSSSPRPPIPPFSCLSRCNRAISYVVFIYFSFPSRGEHMPSVHGSRSSFIRYTCPAHFIRLFTNLPIKHFCMPTSSLSSSILLRSILFTPAIRLAHPVVFTHLQSMLVFLGNR